MKNKKAFTLSCKTFSSDSSQAKLTQPPAQSSCFLPFNGHAPSEPETSALRQKSASQTKFRSRAAHSYGFTLAETLIVLVILGVVAAITVPALVNRHVEAERRTKLRKAMTVYEAALNKMVIENGIKSDTALTNWADSNTKNDCANTSAYFKASRNLEINGNATNCKFRAPDGVFWDISDIKKPLVALREQDLNAETAQSDTNRAFYMFGWFDEQGSLRSNDMGKISATDKADLQKLYDFIAGKSKTSMANLPEDPPEVIEYANFLNEYEKALAGDYSHECGTEKKGCIVIGGNGYSNGYSMYDSNGNLISGGYGCEDFRNNKAFGGIDFCETAYAFKRTSDGKIYECSMNGNSCWDLSIHANSSNIVCNDVGYAICDEAGIEY